MEQFLSSAQFTWVFVLLLAWTLPWKGYALWKAALRHDRWWFIVLLIVNTAAILEILYIFIWSERKRKLEPASPKGL